MKPTLLVLAAGMGSRYGGLKQLDPVGPHGELIIDYSLYDAKRAGFDTAVFVIKKENEEALNQFKTKYKEEEYKAEISPFSLNKTGIKVLEKLNEEANYEKIFISEEIPNKDIIFIYRLFLQLINKDNKKINQNDTELWKSAKDIIFTNKKEKLGNHLTQMIKEINLSDDNILIINDMCKGKKEILTPKYYTNLCPTTALFVLIIKDIFEYCGILIGKKPSLPMQYKKLEFAVKRNKEKEEIIKKMIEKANK